MNGAADMGGMHGFGSVDREVDEPVFHAAWERRAFALTMAMAAAKRWSMDDFRFAREKLPPPQYLNTSYYGLWVVTLENLLREHGIATPAEIAAGHSLAPAKGDTRTVVPDDIANMIRRGARYERLATAPARFKVGDRVRAQNMHPNTHTRLPRYVRSHVGEIVSVIGCHVFPDSKATVGREDPHWLYSVRFDGNALWGEEADPTLKVHVDAWEPYLEPA